MKIAGEISFIEQYANSFLKVLIDYSPKLVAAILLLLVGIWLIRIINSVSRKIMVRREVEPTLIEFLSDIIYWGLRIVLFIAVISKLVFEVVIGIAAGVLTGVRKGGFLDNLVLVSTLVVISIPIFVIGALGQYFLGVKLGWFPVTVGSNPTFYQLLLPGMVLGALSIAYVSRLTRTNLVENLRADYVRTAIAKGLTRRRAVGLHALRNSLIPVVTFIGFDFGGLLGGAIVTERIFNIQGVGSYIYRGINNRDGMAVVGAVTVLVLVYLIVNLIVDLLYGVLDPRISHD